MVLRSLSFRVLPPSRIEANEWDRVLIRCEAANAIGLSWKINPKSVNFFEHKNGSFELKNNFTGSRAVHMHDLERLQEDISRSGTSSSTPR